MTLCRLAERRALLLKPFFMSFWKKARPVRRLLQVLSILICREKQKVSINTVWTPDGVFHLIHASWQNMMADSIRWEPAVLKSHNFSRALNFNDYSALQIILSDAFAAFVVSAANALCNPWNESITEGRIETCKTPTGDGNSTVSTVRSHRAA